MKRKQPETSKEANLLKTFESRNADYKRILKAYEVIGSGHYEDVAIFLGLKDLNIVSRRMKEMRELNLLINTGVKKPTSRKRSAFVHTLCNKTQPITSKQLPSELRDSSISQNKAQQDTQIQNQGRFMFDF